MKDELKDFVQKHRSAFDDKEVPAKVWESIDQSLFKNSFQIRPIHYWQAAAVVFFAMSSFLLVRNGLPLAKPGEAKEFADTEAFYTQQIQEKVALIHSVNTNDLSAFAQDLQQLEAMYAVLKEELDKRPSEKVKDALILNLMVRTNLLNKQLQELDRAQESTDSEAALINS